jgi:hypothetical protein
MDNSADAGRKFVATKILQGSTNATINNNLATPSMQEITPPPHSPPAFRVPLLSAADYSKMTTAEFDEQQGVQRWQNIQVGSVYILCVGMC